MQYLWKSQGKANTMQQVLRYIMQERNLTKEQMLDIVRNTIKSHDSFLFRDMDKAIDKLLDFMKQNKTIAILGDYDCDGVTSTALMYMGIKNVYSNVIYKLPDRVKDGYGLSTNLVDFAEKNNAELIITVDNGIAAVEATEYAKSKGIDVIITDHHEPQEILPDCLIIDAKEDKNYPFDGMCGCGVAFKFIIALYKKLNKYEELINSDIYTQMKELVCIATIADVVNLVDENRKFVQDGLETLSDSHVIGIKKLLELGKVEKCDAGTIGFFIGPCINAAGRMKSPDIAINLLLADDEVEAEKIAKELLDLNNLRKDIQNKVAKSIEVNDNDKCIVAVVDKQNAGINGIIASKLVNKYNRPCFVLSDGDKLGGSGRTYGNFSIISCIENHTDIVKGGGHKEACGISIKKENLELFKQICNKEYEEFLNSNDVCYDLPVTCELNFQLLNMKLINNISKLEPFGNGNPSPRFMSRNIEVSSYKIVGKNKNVVQFKFDQNFINISGVGFEQLKETYESIGEPENVDILYEVGVNEWPKGIFKIQLNVIDIKRSI